MSVPTQTRAAAYRQSSILTAPPAQLVVMLYDGARRFLHQASSAMREGNRLLADQRLRRAEAILSELQATLDAERGGEIASRLEGIYVFCKAELLRSRADQNASRVDFVRDQLTELREAWAQLAAA
jgi:flagellar protein FliS